MGQTLLRYLGGLSAVARDGPSTGTLDEIPTELLTAVLARASQAGWKAEDRTLLFAVLAKDSRISVQRALTVARGVSQSRMSTQCSWHAWKGPIVVRRTDAGDRRRFALTLRQVIQLSRECASGCDDAASRSPAAGERLEHALAEVQPELLVKLWALLLAGKNGEDIGAVSAGVADGEESRLPSLPASLIADCLSRGSAIAAATQFDLESPLVSWPGNPAETVDERAWLSFAKQLARNQPGDWTTVAVFNDHKPPMLTKIYLRVGGKPWWSFRGVLDRPSARTVASADKRRRVRVTTGESLHDLAICSFDPQQRALSRAMRAIRARTGVAAARPVERARPHG